MHEHDHYLESKPLKLEDVEKNGAAVGKLAGKKVAAYKDGETVKAVSAICTHKFCIVQVDDASRGWYCPCHGARFALDGQVLSGPAEQPLPEVKVKVAGGELKLDE